MEPVVALYYAVVAAAWLLLVGWTYRDATRRGSDVPFAWGTVAVFFLAGFRVSLLVCLPWAIRYGGTDR